MSFQAITDILVNPQTADLQMSKSINEPQSYASSFSFTDLVASFKNDSESKPVEENKINQTPQNKAEEKVESKSEEKTEVSAEKVSNAESEKVESENDEKLEKTDEVKEKKDAKTEVKAGQAKPTDKSSEKNGEIKAETKSELKSKKNQKVEKQNPEAKENKQTAELDFSRIEELQNVASEKIAEKSKPASKLENKEKEDKTSEVNFQGQAQISENPQLAIAESKEDSDVDFNFAKDESKEKTVTKLDKDGKITVQDLRTEKKEPLSNAKTELNVTDVKFTNENTATITMDLNNAEIPQDSNFQAMLNNQIQANVPEFVKTGSIILKDNNQGTINLVLHPDDLGNVKIHLTMEGKTVTAHITVATKEALQVFKDNAETLREAFIKNGFDAASFDVAYGNNGSGNQDMNFAQQQDGTNHLANHVYTAMKGSDSLDSMLDDFIGNEEKFENFSINIVA